MLTFISLLWALDVRWLGATYPDGCVLNKQSKGCVGGNAATRLLVTAGVAVSCGKSLVEGGLHGGRRMSLMPPYMCFLAVQQSHSLLSLL